MEVNYLHVIFQELSQWNARYREKFGFVFLICASGRTTDEILAELKVNLNLKFSVGNTFIYLTSILD